jgi:hypothetical protein
MHTGGVKVTRNYPGMSKVVGLHLKYATLIATKLIVLLLSPSFYTSKT